MLRKERRGRHPNPTARGTGAQGDLREESHRALKTPQKGGRHEGIRRREVGDRDVLVRVSAASINPLDKMVRNGEFKQPLKYKTPFVLGHDVAGVVTRVGSAVHGLEVGDEVYARPRDLRIGGFAEFIAIDMDDVAPKPDSLTLQEAAAVPLVALAA